MTRRPWLPAVLILSFLAGCDTTPGGEPAPTPADVPGTVTVALDDRPFQLHVPDGYDPAKKAPLVVLLHGFRASAAQQESYFKLTGESDRRGFLLAMPDGTTNRNGQRFWNATEACCDFDRSGVDDSAYLRRLLDRVKSSYSVDPGRVYVVGHSNGGFMAYRMACDHATEITAIVSLAGAATDNAAQCTPKRPVSVLQIHGTSDQTIFYDGGAAENRSYTSVADTLALWRDRDGCTDQAQSAAPIDLVARLAGPETSVTTYATGCRENSRVELWSIKDGSHVPEFNASFAPAVMDFLYARAR